jgi:hypothetical protein
MTCSSSRIDLAARRLLSSIAGTRDARVSAMALAHMRGAGKTLVDAGLLVQRGSATSVVAEDDLDDTPISVIAQAPIPQRKSGARGFFQYFTQRPSRAWMGSDATHIPHEVTEILRPP